MSKGLGKLQFKREYFIKLFIEVFSVIFAVLLALFVNEWRQEKANMKLAENAYANISKEITENKKNVDSALVKHSQLILALDSAILKVKNHSMGEDYEINIGSIEMEVLSSTAWATIKSTQVINYMNFDKIMDISNLYSVQEIYTKTVDKFLNDPVISDLYSFDDIDDSDKAIKQKLIKLLITIKSHLIRIVDVGKQLSNTYQKNINQLNVSGLD